GCVDLLSCVFCFANLELRNLPKLKALRFGGDAFQRCNRLVLEDLPELTSIQMGERAFTFNAQEPHNELILRNLPKLTTLTSEGWSTCSFRFVHTITVESTSLSHK
ncbi:hypothetical protein WA577_002494, partial [Blastocystis sp. JDR]